MAKTQGKQAGRRKLEDREFHASGLAARLGSAAAAARAALGTTAGRHLARFAAAGAAAALLGLGLAAPGSRTSIPAPESSAALSKNPFPIDGIEESAELPAEAAWTGAENSLGLSDALSPDAEPQALAQVPSAELAEAGSAEEEDAESAEDFAWADALAVARERAASRKSAGTPQDGPDSWIRAARQRRAESLGFGTRPAPAARGVRALTAFRGEVYPAGLSRHAIRRVKARKAIGQLRAAKALAQAAMGAGATEEEAAQRIHNAFDQQVFRGTRLAPGSVPGAADSAAKGGGVRLPAGAESRAPFIAPVGAPQRKSSR